MSHFKPWPYARALAHRGGGTLAPENTIAAIEVGRQHGYRAIEFDAMLSRDEVPVLIHDDTLNRTTNGRGPVSARSAAELTQLDAGSWFSPQFAGEALPLFERAVQYCRTHEVWINIELKPAPGFERRTGEVVARDAARLYQDVLREQGDRADNIEPRVPLLSSFARAALEGARHAAPDLPRGFLFSRIPANWQQELEALKCVALHTDHKNLTPALARAVKDAGYWLFCYTVNESERAHELMDWGVDAFCTDRIDLIAASKF